MHSTKEFGNGDIVTRELRTGTVINHTQSKEFEGWPAFGDDTNCIFYTIDTVTSGTLWKQNLLTKSFKQLTKDSYFDRDILQLTGTEWLIFCRAYVRRPYSLGGMVWGRWDICCVSTNGGQFYRVTSERFHAIDCISLVSTNILIFSAHSLNLGDDKTAFRLDFSTSKEGIKQEKLEVIRDLAKWSINNVIWNSKVESILFTSNRDTGNQRLFDYDIYSMKLDGTGVKRHTGLGAICGNLAASQLDGSVFFTMDKGRDGKHALMRLDQTLSKTTEIMRRIR